ncbi:hypothetical protein PAPYR_5057 [Paratrimastix pyriformis]|uniref:Uncharacterized protein n=1 Tax=Paratrimastix pyriformis TaxID=342808 RepID=A0ABQ8UKQ7_9EUKA|nr:hypothetical protein PAPYR_5057 [Paratrimastix pyriformis]
MAAQERKSSIDKNNVVHMTEIHRACLRHEETARKQWDSHYGVLVDFYDQRAQILNPERPALTATTRAQSAAAIATAAARQQTPPPPSPEFLCNHFHTMRREITHDTMKNGSIAFVTTNSLYGANATKKLDTLPREKGIRQ